MELLPGFFGMLMVFVIYIAVGIDGLAYDAVCTADGDCTDTNANKCIDDSGTLKCKCNDDSFRRTSPAECVIKILAGETCITGDTCADGNAACDGTSCECGSGYFQKNDKSCATEKTNVEDVCVSTETAANQCAVTDSECRNNECLCKTTHYKADATTCTIRVNPDIACTATGQCITNAECDVGGTNKCECNTGYTETPTDTPTMCSGVVKFESLSYMYVVPILVSMISLLR